ncbi:MAG: DUF4428 domain-containing protein [Lachnospiraceae bacterium]|nr:DUF4428 domain-containing protein [Lachnospiraceae bacterium]
MNRLERRKCDICGKLIQPFGYMKLSDGNMCTDCAKLLSPMLKNRQGADVDYIKRHVEYRKENEKKLKQFNPVTRYGYDKKIYIDSKMFAFLVTNKLEKDIAAGNPDIIPLVQVKSCETEIREHTPKGVSEDDVSKDVSLYDFIVTVKLESEWFDEIVVSLNGERIRGRDNRIYKKCESDAKQLKDTLMPDQSFSASIPERKSHNVYRL